MVIRKMVIDLKPPSPQQQMEKENETVLIHELLILYA